MCKCKGGGKNPINNLDLPELRERAKQLSSPITDVSELPIETIQLLFELYKEIYPNSNGLPTVDSLVQQLKDIGNGNI